MSWNKIESIIFIIISWIGFIMSLVNFIIWTFIIDYSKIFSSEEIITKNQFHILMIFLFLALGGIFTRGIVGSWKYWKNKLN